MLKRAIYLGVAAVSAWQFISAINRYRQASQRTLRHEGQAVSTWESEGGNVPTVRRRALRH